MAIIATIITSTIITITFSIIVTAALIESHLHQPLCELLLVKTSCPALSNTPRGRGIFLHAQGRKCSSRR